MKTKKRQQRDFSDVVWAAIIVAALFYISSCVTVERNPDSFTDRPVYERSGHAK